tara:strand:+ start:403 stop:870 length:468 start_codon:yes stop_codon:yes gene_type:complete
VHNPTVIKDGDYYYMYQTDASYGPDYDRERIDFWVNEGPAVIKNKSKIYITYSVSATGTFYCMGMMETDVESDLLDRNFCKKSRHPVLETENEKKMYGLGHNSFKIAADGVIPLSIYHARDYEEIVGDPLYDSNRQARAMQVKFDREGKLIFKFY